MRVRRQDTTVKALARMLLAGASGCIRARKMTQCHRCMKSFFSRSGTSSDCVCFLLSLQAIPMNMLSFFLGSV